MGLLAQVVVPNVLVDPYWYFGGGRLAGLRYPFSTRDAKINRLSSGLPDHDCLISGSSRSLTLDPTAFERHRCFNLAVEGATLSESVELASRFARLATPPRLVLQAIDRFDLDVESCEAGRRRADARSGERPARWLERYVSTDVLRFSRRVRLGRVEGIGYDAQWRPVLDRHAVYEPRWPELAAVLEAHPGGLVSDRVYTDACLSSVDELRTLFPRALLTGYIPPISTDIVLRMLVEGELETYLMKMHGASRKFDRFYDLGVPSELTIDSKATWDGSHFDPSISPVGATPLEGRETGVGLAVHDLTPEQYAARYRTTLARVIERLREPPNTTGAKSERSAPREPIDGPTTSPANKTTGR